MPLDALSPSADPLGLLLAEEVDEALDALDALDPLDPLDPPALLDSPRPLGRDALEDEPPSALGGQTGMHGGAG